jgi:hypothetical protein
VAVTAPRRQTLVLRFADVGVATYASLRVVGQPSRTVTWVVEEPILVGALEKLTRALPDPHGPETQRDAVQRASRRRQSRRSHATLAPSCSPHRRGSC